MSYEKRKFHRFDIFLIIAIKSIKKTAEYYLGITRNFSSQGFSFELHNVDVKLKENIHIKLKHPQHNWQIAFVGNVIWKQEYDTKCIAGIKLGEMDKETKAKLSEIISSNKNVPNDLFHHNRDSELKQKNEERFITKMREKLISEISKNNKRKIKHRLIIGLSISFFMLSGIIIIKALIIPDSDIYYQTAPKELDSKEHLPKSEIVLRKPVKEQSVSQALDKEFLSHTVKLDDKLLNENKDNQHKVNNNIIIKVRSDKNINMEKKLNEKLNNNDQYASRLVYTIQLYSQKRIADAQQQFDSILQSLKEKNLHLLRIEKVDEYFTVRLGKFENYASAKKFLQEIKPPFSTAIILEAYIKNERIIRLHE